MTTYCILANSTPNHATILVLQSESSGNLITPHAILRRSCVGLAPAGMWFLPTLPALQNWLKRAGFNQLDCFYAESLSTEEQRATDDAPISSLGEGMRADGKTKEGYPPPYRYYVKVRRA
eukprot:SAG22_NODE_2691_length_2307_cov_20.591938_3_plen_120_part_00